MGTVAVQLEGLRMEILSCCHCWIGRGEQTGSHCGEEMGTGSHKGLEPGLELGL